MKSILATGGLATLTLVTAVALLAPAAHAGMLLVDDNNDLDDGTDGVCSLREAMQAAFMSADHNECTHTGGTGAPHLVSFSGPFTITVGSTLPNVVNEVAVDGSGQSIIIDGSNAATPFVVAGDGALTLANLTVQNGSGGSGGAVRVDSSDGSLTAIAVTFENNSANSGGAIHSPGRLVVTGGSFEDNESTSTSGEGGAISFSGADASMTLIGVSFTNNSAANRGGAIAVIGLGNPINTPPDPADPDERHVLIDGAVFINNSADGDGVLDGGGALWVATDEDAHFSILHSEFSNNSADNGGGGAILLTKDSRIAYFDSLTPAFGGIFASDFFMNSSGGTADVGIGGAILTRGELTVVSSSFRDNASDAGSGGAIGQGVLGSGLDCGSTNGKLTAANVTFSGNSADDDGGAIALVRDSNNCEVEVINSTFSDNEATNGTGGAIFNNNADAGAFEVANSILADSTAGGNCGGEPIADLGGNVQFPDDACGIGIPVGDPMLDAPVVNPGPNLFVWTMSLKEDSAALGAGDPRTCAAGPILNFDATGTPRPAGDPACDSGAYESAFLGGEAVLTFTPASLDFGPVEVNDTVSLTSTLENTGDADAMNLVLTGPAAPFSQTNDCPATLAPAATCTVTAEFAPTAVGNFSDSIQVAADGGVSASLTLAGAGVPAPGGVPTPEALEVDGTPIASDGNGVFEPGEQVEVAPAWRNNDVAALSLAGEASGFAGPSGATYTEVLTQADYGTLDPGAVGSCLATGVCYALEVDDPADRPAPHWDATFDEALDDAGATTKTWTLHIGDSFADVPRSHLFYRMVEAMVHHGMAMDCGGGNFCPELPETRAMMAMTVLRALEGNAYTPSPCDPGQQEFADVPAGDPFCPWIEELFHRNVIAGCGGGNYCPDVPVTRAQMAVFLLKTLEGSAYTPPPCGGVFDDVSCPSLFADWIEDLFARGITSGCSASPPLYCPGGAITRGQCAAFQSKTFDLSLYGP